MSKHCLGVIGTDTNVGKTIFTAVLGYKLAQMDTKLFLIKAIQTGCPFEDKESLRRIAPDIEVYKEVIQNIDTDICYMLEPPCSPHLALRKVNTYVCASTLAEDIMAKIPFDSSVTIIEGAGGFMTPINNKETFADVFLNLSEKLKDGFNKEMHFSIILVIENKLGALNHALLTYEKIKALGITLSAFVLTETSKSLEENVYEKEIKEDNIKFLKEYLRCDYLGLLPYEEALKSSNDSLKQRAYQRLSTCININSFKKFC